MAAPCLLHCIFAQHAWHYNVSVQASHAVTASIVLSPIMLPGVASISSMIVTMGWSELDRLRDGAEWLRCLKNRKGTRIVPSMAQG